MSIPLQEVFSSEDKKSLKGAVWWVADRKQPYLMKCACLQNILLLQCTNMTQLWGARISSSELQVQKEYYAKSLQIKSIRDLLSIFDTLLTDYDLLARYQFIQSKWALQFTFHKRIKIFDFIWKFELRRIICDSVRLICAEVINPLAATLESQTMRLQLLRNKFETVEKDFMRKMTEAERSNYKSPLQEEPSDLRLLVNKTNDDMLSYFKMDQASMFFSKQCRKQQSKRQQSMPVLEQPVKKISANLRPQFDMQEHQLQKEIYKKKTTDKKKKIDFL